MRLAGDAVNSLAPAAVVGGEVVRALVAVLLPLGAQLQQLSAAIAAALINLPIREDHVVRAPAVAARLSGAFGNIVAASRKRRRWRCRAPWADGYWGRRSSR